MPPSRGLLGTLVAALAASSTSCVFADLPIHCLNAQISGQWEFRLSKAQSVVQIKSSAGVTAGSGYNRDISCGYQSPDKSSQHFAKNDYQLDVDHSFKLTLKTPNIVLDADGNNGTYTMIYDEGYEVFINGYSFFAFMRYRPKETTESLNSIEVGDYISECGHTLIGWYHSLDNKYWGCWQGRQTYRAVPDAWPKRDRKGKCQKYQEKPDDLALLQVDGLTLAASEQRLSLGQDTHHRRSSKVVRPKNAHIPTPHLARRSTRDALRDADGCDDIDTVFDHQEAVVSTTEFSGDTMFFQPDPVFVETHNADTSNLWTATIHEQFVGMKMSELLAMHGIQRFDKSHVTIDKGHDGETDQDNKKKVGPKAPRPPPIKDDRPDEVKYAGLPENFSWLDHDGQNWDPAVRNQGSCGACYAMATVTAFEGRIRVASKNKLKPKLSTQAVLSCSFYNQACDGGYPYLVGKHGAEFGFVDEECYAYTAKDGNCAKQCSNGRRWFFKNYRYIGGYYGACSEVAMMHEIMNGGPIMIAFEAPHTLTYYKGGIFTGPDPKTEPSYANGINPWQHTNHAVVGVGWGVDGVTGTKYWLIKNTWGERWGENGFFRIRRGTNECGVESMATTADVILPEDFTL